MAAKKNVSLDIGICDKELSDSENNTVLEKKSYDKSVTSSNILPSDTRISESKHVVTVSNRDDYNLDVKDTAHNKTEEKEKEINFVIKSLKEDSCVELSIDSCEILHSNASQNKATEDEVDSETVVFVENCHNSGIIQTEIKEKIVKRQDGIEEWFENKECTGSSDFSLENSLNKNDKIETISDEQHEPPESMNFTTAHAIETNNGAQTCENKCSSTKFHDESSRPLKYDGCHHLIATEASQIKPPETKFPRSELKQMSDQLTSQKKNRKKCASETRVNPQRRHIVHSTDGLVYCSPHNEVVKYWCYTCGIAKCEKCVNVVYSRTCISHVVTTIKEHVIKTKVGKITVHGIFIKLIRLIALIFFNFFFR